MTLNKKTFIASLSGFQFGYNTSIIAAAILFIKNSFALSPFELGLVASFLLLGALIASFFSGIAANLLGRKGTLFLSAFLFLLGVTFSVFANSLALLLLGRLIIGFAAALSLIVAPMYLIETSPIKARGAAANMNQIGLSIGGLVAYLAGYFLAKTGNWRVMFALGWIPGIIQWIGLYFLPESPYKSEWTDKRGEDGLLHPSYRPQLFLGLILFAMQALTGAPAIFYFTPTLFEEIGLKNHSDPLLITVWIGALSLIGILVSFWTVDRWGRRPLILFSIAGMVFSLVVVSLVYYFYPPLLPPVLGAGMLFFVFSYGIGVGPIPGLIIGEMTPTPLRAQAMAAAGSIGLLINYLITLTCPLLLAHLELGGTFALYALCGISGLLFLFRALPETKGKDLLEISNTFSRRRTFL